MDGSESVVRFLSLPPQVGVVLLLEFLNSFRSFGMRFVLYNYITNEFGIGDTRAGALLGIKGFVDIGFGLAGSILVDIFGVRRVSLVALSVAIVGRTLLAFGRTRGTLYLALFLFSPCGEALLGVGLYKVALKKLTTPATRPLAFATSYAAFNLAGAVADILIDRMKGGLEDLTIAGRVYTPLRQFVVVTWMVVLLTFLIAYCYLEDHTVVDMCDLEDDETSETETDFTPARPMVKSHVLRRWFPRYYRSIQRQDDAHQRGEAEGEGAAAPRLPCYRMYRTPAYQRGNEGSSSPCTGVVQILKKVIDLLRCRDTWRALIFGFASYTIAINWTASEMILPPFLERRFGEEVPIYTIQSINLFGCLILPPILGALTGGREDFSVILPGLWIMATSPVFVAIFPYAAGACVWQVFMTLGEVLWSPRQSSWVASLAPTGSEGLFFAVSSARSVMGPLADFLMGAMNEKYNKNCPDCRDQYGHFCGNLATENNKSMLQCASVQESCDFFLENDQQFCPLTCVECPSWEPTNPSELWYLLMLVGIATPISVWFFLPFLRGKYNRDDNCYGLFSCTRLRFFGVCGAVDDQDNHHSTDGPQMYGDIEGENDDSEGGQRSIKAHGENVELT